MASKRGFERKIREDQEAAAHVFQEFINTFQDCSSAPNKTFVKSGILYGDKNQEKAVSNQLYTPKPLIQQSSNTTIKNALECARLLKENTKLEKIKKQERRKSNLEQLRDELKLRHSERDERERLKEEILSMPPGLNYFEGGDPNSTNLFVASLNTKVTENDLMKEFGAYGPLASVKIMWPRGEDRFRTPNTNCGFVAYMSRKDAERALRDFKHRADMRVGWGKSVELPTHPAYIPDELLKLYLPPPQSGLPFNAQPTIEDYYIYDDLDIDDVLYDCVVKVTIPLNKKVLMIVNRVVEFVVKEGPMFEAVIMNKELGNPEYNFLFEYKSPVHIYYRWKLYSILNGDSSKTWRVAPFRMFKGGSIWIPPVAPNYSEGMPDQLIKNKREETQLSENQCERLVDLIQNLTMSRNKIAEAMVFCMNHLPAIKDSLDIVSESLTGENTKPTSKIARLYLLSDILSNCQEKAVPVDYLEGGFLLGVFSGLQSTFDNLKGIADRDNFRTRVMRVVRQWDSSKMFSIAFIKTLEAYFLTATIDDIDEGNSSSDEPLDGASLLKRSLKNPADECVVTNTIPEKKQPNNQVQYFVPSKWDTIEPDEVEAQAMSSTKLYYLELENEVKSEKNKRLVEKVEERSVKSKKHKKCDHSSTHDAARKNKESKKGHRRKK